MSSDASGAPRLIRSIVPRAPSAAGMAPAVAARDHIGALAPLWINKEAPMTLVENGSQQLRNGATFVKFGQQVDGVVVNQGEIRVLMHTNGSLAAVAGTLLPSSIKPNFVGTATQALERALDKQFGKTRPQVAITEAGDNAGWQTLQVASAPGLQIDEARARRELANVGGKWTETWAVEVLGHGVTDALTDPDLPNFTAHRYLVKDNGGTIVRDVNLEQSDAFVYRVYAETTGNRRPLDSAISSVAPHPTGVPDGTKGTLIPQNLVVMDSFNGPLDPWLPNNATTTRGNNAESFADLDGNSVFSAGDVRPDVRSGRILNFVYDHTLEPFGTGLENQSKAGAVNSFFVVNWLHDWFYDSGFTEATGNAQFDNLGRGGIANDGMLVAAQAGGRVGTRNNATMATPADGLRPRMRMFLWTAGTITTLNGPNGVVASEPFAAGPRNFDLTAELVVVTDPVAPNNDGCQPPTNVAGKIALAFFSGVCGSAVTVNTLRAAGAIGVVLADGQLENPRAFAGSAAANIPGLAIGFTDGNNLAAAAPLTINLQSRVSGPERDGDFDNTVVAHEWGHYFHHRLSDCGALQCGGMSEGWGDFMSIYLMLRDGENREGAFAVGPYALENGVTPDVAYFGIRRFPYSRDRTKNDLSFRHIGDENPLPTTTPGLPGGPNSEVHNAGEIWTTMLWEAFNVLIDQHGLTVARRRMADYMVGGLLLMPPDATFTEARDGLLASASALDTDDMILMAAAFAGRGAGSCAVSPSNESPTNAGVVESGTLAGKLAAAVSITDDGISCDNDGYLDPGESGQLRITLANNGILAAENVALTASTTATGVRIGAPVRLNLVQPFSSSNLTIPVTVLQNAPRNTNITITLHITGENTCDRNGITITVPLLIGVDDVPAQAKIDRAETKISPWTKAGAGADSLWGRAFDASGNQSFRGTNAGFVSDTQFVSPALLVSTTEPFIISFKHAYNIEEAFDGGVGEISLNGGATWNDVTSFGQMPGYDGALLLNTGNPIAGRQAYSGISDGFPARNTVTMNFGTVFGGLSVMFRFRIGTDGAVGGSGWDIDDVEVSGITNTPFPILVPEPSTCTARQAPTREADTVAVHLAPAVSLDAFDDDVCIANDVP